MKILVATSSHQPDDDRIYHKEIRSLLEAGHEVTLVTRCKGDFIVDQTGFRHHDVPTTRLVAFGHALERLALEWQPDLMIIHEFELLMAASRIRKKQGVPLAYDAHEPNRELWDLASSRPFPVKQLIVWGLNRFEQSWVKHVDHVLVTSPFISDRYRRRGLATTLVPNFPRLLPVATLMARPPVVMYQGQLSIQRGLLHLIRAFVQVLETVPNAKLEILGPEHRSGVRDQLHTSLIRLDLEKAVTLEGPIPHPEVLERLRKVQLGVIPSANHPFFHAAVPIKLFEYMVCGCAVVASDLTAIRHYAQDAVRLVPPGNVPALAHSLIDLLTDAAKRETLVAKGRDLVENSCNWESVEPVFLETIVSLV